MKQTIVLLFGVFCGAALAHLYHAGKANQKKPMEEMAMKRMTLDQLNDELNRCIDAHDQKNAELIVDHIEERKAAMAA